MQNAQNKSISILIIEDDEVDVLNIKRAFKKYRVQNPLFVASNGSDAFNQLKGLNGGLKLEPTPKIILLDIKMPTMNGIEFLKKLRADKELQSITVFVMTTSDSDSDIIDAHNLNVAGYIVKPVSFQQFFEAVSTLSDYWQLIKFPSTN